MVNDNFQTLSYSDVVFSFRDTAGQVRMIDDDDDKHRFPLGTIQNYYNRLLSWCNGK